MKNDTKVTIFTVGHSTHPIDDFVELLKAHGIKKLVDVRTIPKSRYNPQFNGPDLAASVRKERITYRHVTALGGLRHTKKDSSNRGWRNASFRGYADYMQTEEFTDAIEKLLERGQGSDLAIMCAEAVPWRCHRSLIGDALIVRGARVLDIMSKSQVKAHTLTSFAHVEGTHITYPAEE